MNKTPKPDWRAPSKVALDARLQTGAGAHGKRGKGRSKADPRSRSEARAALRRGDD